MRLKDFPASFKIDNGIEIVEYTRMADLLVPDKNGYVAMDEYYVNLLIISPNHKETPFVKELKRALFDHSLKEIKDDQT